MNARVIRTGFTLVELLVVLALVVVLAGGLGLALQPRSGGVALSTAQNQVLQLLGAARLQAALQGRNAALAVCADATDPEHYLRALATAVRDPSGAGWIPLGRWTTLPAGVGVLPPQPLVAPLVASTADWSGLRSDALTNAVTPIAGVPAWLIEVTPRGTVVGGGGRVGLAPGRVPAGIGVGPWQFEHPAAVRGVAVSAYGVAETIDTRAEW